MTKDQIVSYLDESIKVILVIAVVLTLIRFMPTEGGRPASPPVSTEPCEPTPTEVAQYDGHHVVVVMGRIYKVTRIPGGEWEIVGKLERFK